MTVADALQVPKVWSSLDIHHANHCLEDRKPTEDGRLPKLVLGFQKMAADSNAHGPRMSRKQAADGSCKLIRAIGCPSPPTLPFPHLATAEAQNSTSNIQHRLCTAKSKQHHNTLKLVWIGMDTVYTNVPMPPMPMMYQEIL